MGKKEINKTIKEALTNGSIGKEINKLSLFGSYLRGDYKETSDVDLLVEFAPGKSIGLFKLLEIQEKLEGLINRRVDLLTRDQLSRYFRSKILSEAEIIYER